MLKPKLIAIVGPTASGKSSLGVLLAKKLGGEVVSADSRQVYRGLNIGTGKVTKKEMRGVPHHLLDVASPKKQFSVSDFAALGTTAIENIVKKKKLPIVVGGTGLYVDVLLGRISIPEVPPNPVLRVRLEKLSITKLFAMLKKINPRRAATVEPKHKRRLIRAIEIVRAKGGSVVKTVPEYDALWLGLYPGEQKLRENTHARLLKRLRAGMVKEVQKLHVNGLSYNRIKEIGFEQRLTVQLIQGDLSKKEFIKLFERDETKYAKRQMRWFKRNKDIRWVSSEREALRLALEFMR